MPQELYNVRRLASRVIPSLDSAPQQSRHAVLATNFKGNCVAKYLSFVGIFSKCALG